MELSCPSGCPHHDSEVDCVTCSPVCILETIQSIISQSSSTKNPYPYPTVKANSGSTPQPHHHHATTCHNHKVWPH
ncbi:hypothetical protein ACOSQ3_016303 [Xanthoceras sorbifolium]